MEKNTRPSSAKMATTAHINTLAEFLTSVRSMAAAGHDQHGILVWMTELATQLGIRIRHDECPISPKKTAPVEETAPAETAPAEIAPVKEVPAETAPVEEVPGDGAAEEKKKSKKTKLRPIPVMISRDGQLYFPTLMSDTELRAIGGQTRFATATADADDEPRGMGRVILSCDRRNVHVDIPLCAECNGIVLDANTWNILASPPRAFNPRPAAKMINRHLAKDRYDIIKVDDGTVVTFYSWNHPLHGPIWCMATGNGYDVSALKWMGAKTYAETFAEVLAMYAPDGSFSVRHGVLSHNDIRLDFNGLDPDYCYTVGFRHTAFHPLPTDRPRMWQIQRTHLKTNQSEFGKLGLPNVPHQHICKAEELAEGTLTVEKLQAHYRDALEQAKTYIATEIERGIAAGLAITEIVGDRSGLAYGYILRSHDVAATGEYSDILLESSLLTQVRRLIYQRPPRAVRDDLDHMTRLEYNALKAFLNLHDRGNFQALFPQFKERYATYENFVNNIVHLIITMHRQTVMEEVNGPSPLKNSTRSATATIAKALLAHIVSHEKLNVFHKDVRAIVRDYVVQPQYALMYLKAMRPNLVGGS